MLYRCCLNHWQGKIMRFTKFMFKCISCNLSFKTKVFSLYCFNLMYIMVLVSCCYGYSYSCCKYLNCKDWILLVAERATVQGGRGHQTVNYTGTRRFIIKLALKLWVLLLNFDQNQVVSKLFNQYFVSHLFG